MGRRCAERLGREIAARGVVVVEGAQHSGSLIPARLAMDSGGRYSVCLVT
jgi:predicted Rossmann fold nucleotide-binding protein DprA/Smf involved in DNA uptake